MAAAEEVRGRRVAGRYDLQQKEIKELRAEINKLGALESAAVTVRAKERQLKDMLDGGKCAPVTRGGRSWRSRTRVCAAAGTTCTCA